VEKKLSKPFLLLQCTRIEIYLEKNEGNKM
jgi:hypothetical protein